MERNIPDVRDIFGRSAAQQKQQQQRPELRSYDCSPRSRRRHDAMDSYENNRLQSHARTPSSETPPSRHSNSSSGGNKKTASSRNRCSEDFAIGTGRKSSESRNNRSSEDFSSGRKTSAEDSSRNVKDGASRNASSKDGAGRNGKDAHHYSNRTLTERDIRHLERHLSMKKTIRKQISRNLAQAFVDDPDLVLKDTNSPSQKGGGSNKVEKSFTLTRAKVSRSEQNVLDLLKDNEPDSGHCSADNPNSSDDDCNDLKTHQRHPVKQHEGARKQQQIRQSPATADSVVVARKTTEQQQQPAGREDSKFSFWKMFSVKSKGKR